MTAQRHSLPRSAKTKCRDKLKKWGNDDMDDDLNLQVLGGDIIIQDLFEREFEPKAAAIYDEATGVIWRSGLPTIDEANGDYVSRTIYFNEPDTVYYAKTIFIMFDDADYCNFIKERRSKYPGLKAVYEKFRRFRKKQKLDVGDTEKMTVKEFASQVFGQSALWIGRRAYSSLTRRHFTNTKSNSAQIAPLVIDYRGHHILCKIAKNVKKLQNKIVYQEIDGTEFNALFGIDYVTRKYNKGYFYLDNIKLTYMYGSQYLHCEYVVAYKNAKGKRQRNLPARQ